ncbi:MAG: hypothetical protein LUI13_09035 [Lachnospiraceae bacterium]|nr:hypothetical protein [Lachnospiraceae bacterium]
MEGDYMTDKQFRTIFEMFDMILDGCKDLDEAKEKVHKLIKGQSSEKTVDQTEKEVNR